MFLEDIEVLLCVVILHLDALIAGLRSNTLYARQSFEHALDALLTALSSDPLAPDNFQSNGLEHDPYPCVLIAGCCATGAAGDA